jgi:REP element-mobilizing transposase RayT
MARKSRIYFPGALYHVIGRGNQKQNIFLDEQDFRVYLSYLSEYKNRFSFHLYAFALMENHFHLLVEVEQIPLSKIMQGLQFRYARYFNKKYQKVGHLFQGRYKAILCDQESYLLELICYIHLNPVRAGKIKGPDRYPWTSHLDYLNDLGGNLVDSELVLHQFSRQKSVARKRYLQFILERIHNGHEEKYYQVKDQRYLGGEDFIERVEQPDKCQDPVYFNVPMEVIVSEVLQVMDIPPEQIFSLTRDRRGALGRGTVAYLARKLAKFRVKDIAQYFHREPMTISLGVRKIEKLIEQDKGFAKVVNLMELNLKGNSKRKYFITNA